MIQSEFIFHNDAYQNQTGMVAQTSINYPPVDQTGLSSKDRGRGPHIMQEQYLTQPQRKVK